VSKTISDEDELERKRKLKDGCSFSRESVLEQLGSVISYLR